MARPSNGCEDGCGDLPRPWPGRFTRRENPGLSASLAALAVRRLSVVARFGALGLKLVTETLSSD
jgi:hypothetical protein